MVVLNRDVKVGDKIAVTKVNYEELERVHFSVVTGVYDDFGGGIEIEPHINGENILHIDQDEGDKWRVLAENPQYDEEETLQHRQAHAYYDDEALFQPSHVADETITPKEGQIVKVVCDGQSEYGEVVETDVSDAGEYEFKVKSGESSKTYKLNQIDSVEAYEGDEYKIMPNYIQLASQGMTFSEFAGEKITAKSLNFRPYDDKVNHPNHYNKYSREVIESIKGLCTPDEFRGYLKGNIIKYSARYSDKDGIQDIDKLAKYTQFLKEFELEMAELSEEE